MEVEKREKAVRVSVILTETEFTELCGAACNSEVIRRLPQVGRDLINCITGIEVKGVKTREGELHAVQRRAGFLGFVGCELQPHEGRGPYKKNEQKLTAVKPRRRRRKAKLALQELETNIVDYLNGQRYATKYQIANHLGNPKPLMDRAFMEKLVTKGVVCEVNWRKLGIPKGIYYATPNSPALSPDLV